MKVGFFAAFLALASTAVAQEIQPTPPPAPLIQAVRTKQVILQPLPWAIGIYGGSFEIAVTDRLAIVSGIQIVALTASTSSGSAGSPTSPAFSSSTSISVLGAGIQPGIAFYLVGRAPTGLWLSPKIELTYLSINNSSSSVFSTSTPTIFSSTTSGFVYGGHVMVGYTYAFEIGFTLQGGVGLGYSASSFSTTNSSGGVPGAPGTPFGIVGSFGRLSLGAGWTF